MIHQRISPAVRRLLGRAGFLVATALWFLLSGGPAAHADDGGLLQDPVPTVLETTTQTVEPVVQTPVTAVPPPEEQAVAPAVPQALDPAVTAAQEAVEPAVKAVEHAVGPGSRVVEDAGRDAAEPAPEAVEPAVGPVPVPAEPLVPTVGAPNSSHPGQVSPHGGPQVVDGGAKVRAAKQSHPKTADPTDLTDLAPRATGRTWILEDHGAGDDQGQERDPGLWALTNALMHQIAGDPLPEWINAGLPPGAVSIGTPWAAPLLLVLLGFLCLVVARRLR